MLHEKRISDVTRAPRDLTKIPDNTFGTKKGALINLKIFDTKMIKKLAIALLHNFVLHVYVYYKNQIEIR